MRRTARFPGLSIRAAVVAALALVLVPRITEAALSTEDRTYADFLIKELRYYDTALRWLDELEKGGRLDQATQADIASMRIEVLTGQGRSEEALQAVAEFQRKFPNDPRTSVGDLHGIADSMRKVLELFDRSNVEANAAKSAALKAEGVKTFEEEVSKPLDALIADLLKKVEQPRAGQTPGKEARAPEARGAGAPRASVLLQSLHYSELVRLQFHLAYARKLAEGSPERTAVLQKGFKLAQDFVQNRYDFPVMQYEAQLNLGTVAYELGRHDFAEEELSVLYELTPPFEPPYTKELVDSFKAIRLQAILIGARAKSAGRNYQRAVEIIKANFLKRRKDEFDLVDAENEPAHKTYAVLVRLEYAIALAGSGSPQEAFDVIDKVIEKPGQPMALVTDARKALGRIALMGGIRMRGRDYYQAAIGLKSERNWLPAIETFQQALGSLNPRDLKEKAELAPLCLNEIGEINLLLGSFTESALAYEYFTKAALAYEEIFSYFPDAPQDLLTKAATNFLAATTRAIKAGGGNAHSGLAKLKEEAAKESERYSSGFQIYESLVFDGKTLEVEGKYAKAREKYLEIARELKGQKVPFYWFAQASAWSCVYYQWDQADPEGKKTLLSEIDAARAALPEVIEKGLSEKDRRGAAKASLILGSIHYQHGEWKDASRVLQVFAGQLADESTFRCTGLGSLILAQVKTKDLKGATGNFKALYTDCRQASVVATVALALSDAFEEAGNLPQAALYSLFHARHPAARSDMENPREIARVARRLIDGGRIKDAQGYIAKLKDSARGDADLERTVVVLEARVHAHAKEWDKAIEKLEAYVKQFKPVEDKSYDDAYALQDLGDAYLARRGTKSTTKDLTDADDAYNQASFVMRRRMQREPALEKTYWKWVESLMTIKMRRGDTAGEVNQYREIVQFLGEQAKDGDMGGQKDRLLKISAEAAAKLEKAQGKSP